MEQTQLLNPLTKVNANKYEVYDGRKFLGYIEVAKVKENVSLTYKYTVGLVYGGDWQIKAKELDKYLSSIAHGMVITYRKRKGLTKEAWSI